MRFLAALLVALVPVTSVDAEETRKYVDLDRPGAFEALRQDNPGHYAEAARLIRAASETSCYLKSGSSAVKADPMNKSCTPLYLTSFPPKRRIRFQLGDTSYGATVTLENVGAVMRPAIY